jgi:hypothetical protein
MRKNGSAGLNSRHLIPKTLRSCLGPLDLPYNWNQKFFGILLALSLTSSALLKDLAQCAKRPVKNGIDRLSSFLKAKRLDFSRQREHLLIQVLRRLGSRRLYLYQGKIVVIIDTTEHEKLRSRGKSKRMPSIGSVVLKNIPAREKILGPGYQEIWTGVLLKNRTCLGLTRFLFSDKVPWFRSQGLLEEIEIQKIKRLIWKVFKRKIILVGDRGFRRKELLHLLSQESRTDFVIRLQGDLNVKLRGHKLGLLSRLAFWQPVRCVAHWRENSKKAALCSIRAFAARIPWKKARSFRLQILCVTSENREPIYLATTLPIETVEQIRKIVWLYSSRWTIETFFFNFKESFGAHKFRVFACWKSIDRLLDLAHMAFLVLHLLFVFTQQSTHRVFRRLCRSVDALLRQRALRPPELTMGRFFEAIAIDFHETRRAWSIP